MDDEVVDGGMTDPLQNKIPGLIRDLSHRNKDVRWGAANALARIGTAAVDPLIAALDDKDSVVRLRAAWALGQIGDKRPVDKLILTLRGWRLVGPDARSRGAGKSSGHTRQPMRCCSS